MTESGPTQPADDLRARIATSLQFSFVGAEMDRRDTENVTLTVHDTEKAGDRLLAAVVGPYLARLREENAQLAADRADAVRGYEQERDAATAAHTRNLVLRSEHRTEVERLRAEYDQAVEDWGRNDEQVLADSARLAEENERLRAELVAIGAQRDDAEEERASMVRDLHAAVFDGSTLLPDRPLDTVWEYLLGCVRNDPARLSGGNTPSDTQAGQRCPETSTQHETGVPLACDLTAGHAWAHQCRGNYWITKSPAPSVGADPEDEVLAELREDERQHAELNPKLAAPPAAVADTAHERTKPDA